MMMMFLFVVEISILETSADVYVVILYQSTVKLSITLRQPLRLDSS